MTSPRIVLHLSAPQEQRPSQKGTCPPCPTQAQNTSCYHFPNYHQAHPTLSAGLKTRWLRRVRSLSSSWMRRARGRRKSN